MISRRQINLRNALPISARLSGVCPGAEKSDAAGATAAFGTWRGKACETLSDYGFPSLSSATRMAQVGGSLTPGSRTGAAAPGGPQLIWGLHLTQNSGTLDNTIAGTYDQAYLDEFQRLIDYGLGDAWLRLGWEADADFFSWGVNKAGNGAPKYKQAYRHIVRLYRANFPKGQHQFIWNTLLLSIGGVVTNPRDYYPGNSYVDIISLDIYELDFTSGATPTSTWAKKRADLERVRLFAKACGKPFGIDEWGLYIRNEGGGDQGDDTYYVAQFLAYAKQNLNYECYFNNFDPVNSPGTVVFDVSVGATSLTVSNGENFYTAGGMLRIGSTSVREIDYDAGGRDGTGGPGGSGQSTLTGIPSSGHGSVQVAISAGTAIRRSIKHDFALATGPSDDYEGVPYSNSPHFPNAAQVYKDAFP